jgi:NADH-quinone oxidoreductase subunit J
MFYLYFLIFFFIIFCAILVIISKNPVHSILYLILVFCGSSLLLVSLGSEFLGIIFIVVYVGAIAVLFLFVIMMLNIKIIELNENFIRYLPLTFIIFFILFVQLYFYSDFINIINSFYYVNWISLLTQNSNLALLGEVLYTYFFHFFLLVSLILLLAMVGSIVLTLNHTKYVLRQNIYDQNLRNWKTSVRLRVLNNTN